MKPENILYESKKEDSLLKVIDFGTSKVYNAKTKMNQKFGTVIIYMQFNVNNPLNRLIILLLKLLKENIMKNVIYGHVVLSYIFYFVVIPHSAEIRIKKLWIK